MQKQTKIGKKISFSKWILEPNSEKGTQIFPKFELRLKFWFICCTNICGVFHCCIMQWKESVLEEDIFGPLVDFAGQYVASLWPTDLQGVLWGYLLIVLGASKALSYNVS